MALKSHFLPLDKPKIRFWGGREIDVSTGRLALVTHFLLSDHPKCDLGEFEKAMFQGLAWHCQLIFDLWTRPKCDLGDVKKETFCGCKALLTHFVPLDQLKTPIWMKSKKR